MADAKASLLIELRDLASKGLSAIGGRLGKVAQDAEKAKFIFGGLAAAIAFIGKSALQTAGDFEQWRVAFTTMLGSADKADELLRKIRDFALKTPFDLPQVVTGSKRLLAFGIAAEDLIPTMKALGDISSGVGVDIGRLVNVFGQVRAAGRLMGQEVLQFTNAGIPILELLSDKLEISTAEVKKLGEQGGISFETVREVLFAATEEGGRFHDMMKEQNKTLIGSMAELSDQVTEVKKAIGDALLPAAKDFIQTAIKVTGGIQEWTKENRTLVISILGVTFALSGMMFALGTIGFILPSIVGGISAVTGVMGIFAIAIGAVGSAFASLQIAIFLASGAIVPMASLFAVVGSAVLILLERITKLVRVMFKYADALRESARAQEDWAERQAELNKKVQKGWEIYKKYTKLTLDQVRNSKDAAAATRELTDGIQGLSIAIERSSNPEAIERMKKQRDLLIELRNAVRPSGEEEEKEGKDTKFQEEQQKLREQVEKRLAIAAEGGARQKALDDQHMVDKLLSMGMIDEAKDLQLVMQLDRDRIEQESDKKKEDAHRKLVEERKSHGMKALNALASLQNSKNKTMAAAGKAAAIAQTIISTHKGAGEAAASLAQIPLIGPGLAIAAAAAFTAAGLARVAMIKGTPLAAGGVVLPTAGGTSAIIGEAGGKEAVLPLEDDEAMDSIRDGLGGGAGGITIQVGTLVATDDGIEELTRKIDEKLFHLDRTNERNSA